MKNHQSLTQQIIHSHACLQESSTDVLCESLSTVCIIHIQTPIAKQWMELEDFYGRTGGRIMSSEGDRISVVRPREWTNKDTWDSQRWNHKQRAYTGLDLSLPAYVQLGLQCKSWTSGIGSTQMLLLVHGLSFCNWAALSNVSGSTFTYTYGYLLCQVLGISWVHPYNQRRRVVRDGFWKGWPREWQWAGFKMNK